LSVFSAVPTSFSNNELLAVIYMVCMRLCIMVTMPAYGEQLFSENEYLSVSEDQA